MDRILRPERFDAVPDVLDSDKAWIHWKRTFDSFIASIRAINQDINKVNVLIIYVSPDVFEYISECDNHESAMQVLESTFVVPKNEIFARYMLAARRQQAGET